MPDTFDLWVYGHDFDAAGEEPEHDLHLLDGDGTRVASFSLPPKGQAANRATGCVVYRDLMWPAGRRDVLRMEVVNRPGDWTGSTLLAIYVMPGGSEVSRAMAAGLIRNRPDWPRDSSIGFVEFGFSGMANDETQPTRIDVWLIGPPRQSAPIP